MRVYLDMCSWKRPYDTPHSERVRLEGLAVAGLLDEATAGRVEIVSSEAFELEKLGLRPFDALHVACAWHVRSASVMSSGMSAATPKTPSKPVAPPSATAWAIAPFCTRSARASHCSRGPRRRSWYVSPQVR